MWIDPEKVRYPRSKRLEVGNTKRQTLNTACRLSFATSAGTFACLQLCFDYPPGARDDGRFCHCVGKVCGCSESTPAFSTFSVPLALAPSRYSCVSTTLLGRDNRGADATALTRCVGAAKPHVGLFLENCCLNGIGLFIPY